MAKCSPTKVLAELFQLRYHVVTGSLTITRNISEPTQSWACMHVGMYACMHACGMHAAGRCRTRCELSPVCAALTADAC